jgi:isochorismate synthase EntC
VHVPTAGALGFVGDAVTDLFVPDLVMSIGPDQVGATLDAPSVLRTGLELDTRPEQDLVRFARACEWVGTSERRLTVARTLSLPEIDPLASFAAATPSGHERAFLRLGSNNYVGCSPELLAIGDRHAFTSYKLSGTAPPSVDDPERMTRDPRLVREHAASIAAAADALAKIGTVERGSRQIVRLSQLWHFETALRCIPNSNATIDACLAAVRPVGADPIAEGLAMLSQLEDAPRGLYYGLVGCVLEDGQFEFAQLIRAAFRGEQGWFTRVGAAVTAASTPALELVETRLKLASMRVVLA